MEGVGPIPFRFVLACCLRARSVLRPCAQARVRLSIEVPAGAGGWGVEAGPAPASLPGAAVLPGGGQITATASGGRGAAFPWLAGRLGGCGDGGGSRLGSSPSSLGGEARGPLLIPPLVASTSLPGVRVRPGSWGSLPPAGQPSAGGGGGGALSEPPFQGGWPGGRGAWGSCCLGPSLCPPWAGNIAGVTGDARAMGAQAPYCSGSLWCAAPGRGPCAGLARLCGFARLPQPPRGQAVGGAGARGVQVWLRPSPGRHSPFWGRGDAPSAVGGVEGRRPHGPQAGGTWGGEGVGARRCSLLPRPWGAACGPRPCPPPSLAHPPWVYTGRQGVVGAGRGPVSRQWVSAGGRFPRFGLLPHLPQAGIKAGRLVCVSPGATVLLRPTAPAQSCRPAAGYAGVSGRPTGGA